MKQAYQNNHDNMAYNFKAQQPQNYGKSMSSAMKNSPMIGSPMKPKKMSKDQIAKRKKTMISNAASKVMGGLYSK